MWAGERRFGMFHVKHPVVTDLTPPKVPPSTRMPNCAGVLPSFAPNRPSQGLTDRAFEAR